MLLLLVQIALFAVSRQSGFPSRHGADLTNLSLLARQEVRLELKLSPEKADKFQVMQMQMAIDLNAIAAKNPTGSDPEEIDRVMEDYRRAVQAELSPDQRKRLSELRIQLAGYSAAFQEGVPERIGLTKRQLANLYALKEEERKRDQAVMDRMPRGKVNWPALRLAVQKNARIFEAEAAKVFTPENKAKLVALGGKKLVISSDSR